MGREAGRLPYAEVLPFALSAQHWFCCRIPMQKSMQKEFWKMPIYGYARVSTDGQSHADQVAALKAAGATKVYREKESGVRTDRPQLAKAIAALDHGDVLIVTRLDRLARSPRDLLNVLHEVGERGAAFRSLADTWADTTTPHGKLMTALLAGIAEFERTLIQERCSQGIKRARAAGVRFGRKLKLNAYQRAEAMRRRDAGEPQSLIAQSYRVDQATISRLKAI
jgi:DNA invertase Pin-like site-specific DNA recombinase